MATTQTTTIRWADETGLPAVTEAVYNRQLLTRAYPELLHARFGQRKPLKRRSGTSMVFRRYERLSTATTPLTEGVTPTGTSLDTTDVTATIKQYGNFLVISDLLDLVHVDPVISESSKLLGENMGESMDLVYREILNAGTSWIGVQYDDGGTPTLTSTRTNIEGCITKQALDYAINQLDRQNARKFTSLTEGANKENTWPLAPAYWAIIHPDMERDLYQTANSMLTKGTDFVPVEQYASQSQVMPTEIGKYRSVRFVTSTNSKIWAGGGATGSATYRRTSSLVDVYSCLIFARDAYGIVPLQGGSARTIVHRAGGNTDPLNQRNTVAWKSATTAAILNQNFVYRIECGSLA